MVKLLYVDDTYSIAPQDHALLYNRAAGFCFHMGNFAANEYRVQPFGFWACFKHEEPLQLEALALERNRAARLAQRSPLLGSSVMSFSGSMYNSFANLSKEGDV